MIIQLICKINFSDYYYYRIKRGYGHNTAFKLFCTLLLTFCFIHLLNNFCCYEILQETLGILQVENHSSHGSGDGKPITSVHVNTSEQNHDQSSNASTTSVPSTSEMTLPITSVTSEQTITSVPNTLRTPTASDRSAVLNKAPGTRVYKVVKRDAQHPVKRTRGRWTWYDFTDNQAPKISSLSISETKLSQDSIYLHQTTIPFGLSQSGASYEQLIRSGFPVNGSFNSINFEAEMKQQFSGDMSKSGKR